MNKSTLSDNDVNIIDYDGNINETPTNDYIEGNIIETPINDVNGNVEDN